MLRSKYGLLEIFRATFNRVEAVLMMRRISKRFNVLSRDPYLQNFHDEQDTMFLEVRKEKDLDYLRKMI